MIKVTLEKAYNTAGMNKEYCSNNVMYRWQVYVSLRPTLKHYKYFHISK